MEGRIQQLPEHIANQIAAGEVIQRPASAVKELMENAVDAGADSIRVFLRDGGKTLVQVTDNGSGMSARDARICISRHATSKISTIEDIFRIRTMGFRGEALASIAAVSNLEIRTRTGEDETGTCILAEHSRITEERPCACPQGTSISMKNLFFNVPARRNFLKANSAELKYILDEFTRVALGFPEIFFSLEHNGQQMFHLEKTGLKQRILQVLGSQFNSKLVPVREQTDYLNIHGMVGKPDTARKTRGSQYFFVNNRYIRSPFLHRAVMNAFEGMIPALSHPLYVIYIELDPSRIDINVHPAKLEIKFEDDRVIFAFMQSAIRHALAQFSITPSLDFSLDPEIQALPAVSQPVTQSDREAATSGSIYKEFTHRNRAHFLERNMPAGGWKVLYESPDTDPETGSGARVLPLMEDSGGEGAVSLHDPVLVHQRYILSQVPGGFVLIDPRAALERILYERYQKRTALGPATAQNLLFPRTLHFSAAEAGLLRELLPELSGLGYALEPFGQSDFLLRGLPADLPEERAQADLDQVLEQFAEGSGDVKLDRREKLLRALARHQVRPASPLSISEMREIVDALSACDIPGLTPDGRPTCLSYSLEELEKKFGR